MSTIEKEEFQSNNGWQNIGICKKFARENVPFKLRALWMELVEESFGYGNRITKRISQDDWAEMLGVSKPTIVSQLKNLKDLNLIKVVESSKFIENGGSEPNAYAPCYPKGYGKIKFKDDTTSGSESNKQIEPGVVIKKVEYDKNENVDF